MNQRFTTLGFACIFLLVVSCNGYVKVTGVQGGGGKTFGSLEKGGLVKIDTSYGEFGALFQSPGASIQLSPFSWGGTADVYICSNLTMGNSSRIQIFEYSKFSIPYMTTDNTLTMKKNARISVSSYSRMSISATAVLDESANIQLGQNSAWDLSNDMFYAGPSTYIRIGDWSYMNIINCGLATCSFSQGARFVMYDQSRFMNGPSFSSTGKLSIGTGARVTMYNHCTFFNNGQFTMGNSSTFEQMNYAKVQLNNGVLNQGSGSMLTIGEQCSFIAAGSFSLFSGSTASIAAMSSVQLNAGSQLTLMNGVRLVIGAKATLTLTDNLHCIVQTDSVIGPSQNFTITPNADRPNGFFCHSV